MTSEQFRNLVLEIARVHGQQYLQNTQVAELNDLILEGLQRFCAETRCIYRDKVALTLSTSVDGRFDMRSSTYFEFPMFDIEYVIINSNMLYGPDGEPGMWSQSLMDKLDPRYRTASPGVPQKAWVISSPSTLVLSPTPSATTGSHYVSGWGVHPAFTNDQTELSLNLEDQRPAAPYVAYDLLLPHANGPGIEKLEYLRKYANDQKAEVAARAGKTFDGPSKREPHRQTLHRI